MGNLAFKDKTATKSMAWCIGMERLLAFTFLACCVASSLAAALMDLPEDEINTENNSQRDLDEGRLFIGRMAQYEYPPYTLQNFQNLLKRLDKRINRGFYGKRSDGETDEDYFEKRARGYMGKRVSRGFMGKRTRGFMGKR